MVWLITLKYSGLTPGRVSTCGSAPVAYFIVFRELYPGPTIGI